MEHDVTPKPPKASLYRNEPPPPGTTASAPIVVVRPPLTSRERFFRMAGKTLRVTVRVLLYIGVFILSSVGLTALVNTHLRELLIEPFMPFVQRIFGG